MQAKVLVVGSLNMDLVVRAPRLPRGGETLAGQSFTTIPGGPGVTQRQQRIHRGSADRIRARDSNPAGRRGQRLAAAVAVQAA
ncbi:ribokinase, partial [Pseudomonas aeruginosa]|nr:ribokinase [Pseudomonas aeruginosa]